MVHHDTLAGMDGIPPQDLRTADQRLADAAEAMQNMRPRRTPAEVLATALEEFGEQYQITAEGFCYVAVKYPTPTRTDVVVGHDPHELLAKLRADREAAKPDEPKTAAELAAEYGDEGSEAG